MADTQQPEHTTSDVQSATEHEGSSPLKCCCGSLECVFLRHNNAILDNVEQDVHQAARMGQALLARHESYMADAERDRVELTARIDQLESDNRDLEAMNAKIVEENADLLDQLEALNTDAADSEAHVKSLEATLLSSQQTIRRLEAETIRAEALERQIASLEEEQAELQGTLSRSREEARSAAARWKRAERGINDLQEQLERIEKEATVEREHHIEMMNRIERQREMEKELSTAAGRLKGAAASKSMTHENKGSNVVSHFVRDLLQDNANLQCAIAELREMLMNSNDEIQGLRDQLEYHQPLGDGEGGRTLTLGAELGPKHSPLPEQRAPSTLSQELHIHHHYHVSATKQDPKKPKRKRLGLTASILVPPVISQSQPSTPPSGLAKHPSVPHSRKGSVRSNRWSAFSEQPSEFAPSSAPSSPRSNLKNSLFDHSTVSFPGSPTSSIDPISPPWQPIHKKRASAAMSARGFQAPTCFPFGPVPPSIAHPIVEESPDGTEIPIHLLMEKDNPVADDDDSSSPELGIIQDDDDDDDDSSLCHDGVLDSGSPVTVRPRRVLSHESIISLSGGLDIHTLKVRPSQLTIRQLGSASSVTASSIVTARPMILRDSAKRSSTMLRDNITLFPPVGSSQSHLSAPSWQQQLRPSGLGRWASWRPWSDTSAGTSIRSVDSASQQSESSQAATQDKGSTKTPGRSPGINQPGNIPGFSEFLAAAAKKKDSSVKTMPDVIDHDALAEGLSEL